MNIFLLILILIGIALYGLVFLIRRLIKSIKGKYERTRLLTDTLLSFLLLVLPVFLLLFIVYAYTTSIDNHNNVKRGTLLWFVTMTNSTITNFPQIDPVEDPTFNYVGTDAPSINVGCWEINYSTNKNFDEFFPIIKQYLYDEGYKIERVIKPDYGWNSYEIGPDKLFYNAMSDKHEYLTLTIVKEENGNAVINAIITE